MAQDHKYLCLRLGMRNVHVRSQYLLSCQGAQAKGTPFIMSPQMDRLQSQCIVIQQAQLRTMRNSTEIRVRISNVQPNKMSEQHTLSATSQPLREATLDPGSALSNDAAGDPALADIRGLLLRTGKEAELALLRGLGLGRG
jgi:hypothetical protein